MQLGRRQGRGGRGRRGVSSTWPSLPPSTLPPLSPAHDAERSPTDIPSITSLSVRSLQTAMSPSPGSSPFVRCRNTPSPAAALRPIFPPAHALRLPFPHSTGNHEEQRPFPRPSRLLPSLSHPILLRFPLLVVLFLQPVPLSPDDPARPQAPPPPSELL